MNPVANNIESCLSRQRQGRSPITQPRQTHGRLDASQICFLQANTDLLVWGRIFQRVSILIPLKECSLCLIPGFEHPHKGEETQGSHGAEAPPGPQRGPDGPTELQDMENSNPRDISQGYIHTQNAAGTATQGHRDQWGLAVLSSPQRGPSAPHGLSRCAQLGWTEGLLHAWKHQTAAAKLQNWGWGTGWREGDTEAWGGGQGAS